MASSSTTLEDPRITRLGTDDVFSLWELGKSRHRVDWALDVLSASVSGFDWPSLCALPLGRRDAFLLAVRAKSFGRDLDLFASCPACDERVEFGLDIGDLIIADPFERWGQLPEGWLNSVHIAQALASGQVKSALGAEQLNALAHELREQAGPDGVEASQQDKTLLDVDPMAVLSFPMGCPACSQSWAPVLDVPELFWADIVRQGKRALADVHDLAQAYGWTEDVILSMGAERRAAYIAMIHR